FGFCSLFDAPIERPNVLLPRSPQRNIEALHEKHGEIALNLERAIEMLCGNKSPDVWRAKDIKPLLRDDLIRRISERVFRKLETGSGCARRELDRGRFAIVREMSVRVFLLPRRERGEDSAFRLVLPFAQPEI